MSIIIPSNSIVSGGFSVDNSCRFDDGSSDTMSRDNGTPTNLKKFSISLWFKRTEPGLNKYLITGFDTEDNRALLQFSSDQLLFQNQTGGSNNTIIKSNAVFRDSSAWYHFCIIVDTTQGTDTNRVKMYVNGSQVTSLASSTYPSVNTDLELTDSANSILLNQKGDGSDFNSGYYSEVVVLDGTAASITDFGEFDEDSGIWKPINVSGLTFGNNGFYLDFEDSANLGNDANGGTDFTESNLTAVDQSTDTCTNNFATMNPLSSGMTLTEGNLNVAGAATAKSTFGVASGKWYVEMKATNAQTYNPIVGIATASSLDSGNPGSSNHPGSFSESHGYDRSGVIKSNDNTAVQSGLTTAQSNGDIIGLAVDLDSGTKTAQWYVNGSSVGSAVTLVSDESYVFMTYSSGSQSGTGAWNFGSPSYANSSSVADGNGYGSFEYEPPSGYFALCTKNLAEYG